MRAIIEGPPQVLTLPVHDGQFTVQISKTGQGLVEVCPRATGNPWPHFFSLRGVEPHGRFVYGPLPLDAFTGLGLFQVGYPGAYGMEYGDSEHRVGAVLVLDGDGNGRLLEKEHGLVETGHGVRYLCLAVIACDMALVSRLISLGVDPLAGLAEPLMTHAVPVGQVPVWTARALRKEVNGWTALHYAAVRSAHGLRDLLGHVTSSPDVEDAFGSTPLHLAARLQLVGNCELLCAAGADPERGNRNGKTPLAYARDETLRELLQGARRKRLVLGRRARPDS